MTEYTILNMAQYIVTSAERLRAVTIDVMMMEEQHGSDYGGRSLIRREIGILIRRTIKLWWLTWKKPGKRAK